MRTPTTVRSMSITEKQRLRLLIEPNLLSGNNWRMGGVILSFFGVVIIWVSIIVILIMNGFPQNYATIMLKATPIIAMGIPLLIYYKLLRTWTPRSIIRRSKYARDYDNAQVHVYQFSAFGALFLLEGNASDLGIIEKSVDTSQHHEAFIVDIGNGSLLFLRGAYLEKLVTNQRFPCREFNVLRLPNAGETLCIEPIGLPISHDEIKIISNIDWDSLPEDFAEIQGRINEVAGELCIVDCNNPIIVGIPYTALDGGGTE